jgi:hypothetical protein
VAIAAAIAGKRARSKRQQRMNREERRRGGFFSGESPSLLPSL